MAPRPHHYEFAHVLLPRTLLGLAAGRSWVGLLLDPNVGQSFIAHLWKTLGESTAEPLPGEGPALSVESVGPGRSLLVVSMPTPLEPGEAHFVAALVDTETHQTLRYITLEKSALVPAMLCEWNEDGHANFGEAPVAGRAEFVAAVRRVVGDSAALLH